MKHIGVLAVQGSFAEHAQVLERLGVSHTLVRTAQQLEPCTHLILPGGESTTQQKLLELFGLWDMLAEKSRAGALQVYGTCAGAILAARFGSLDIEVDRNAYGAQLDSFETTLESNMFPGLPGVFIRAPRFTRVGADFRILAQHGGQPVLVEYHNFLLGSFHPELTEDGRVHTYFVQK